MAMHIIRTICNVHEDCITSIAFNRVKREIFTAADGDRAIKVWDLRTGQLLRTQTVHRGMVTSLAYASSVKLLFSGSIDGTIGVWTDKGSLLQVVPTGWPVFSVAWGSKQRILVAGGNSVLHFFKVDMSDVLRLKHARHNAQPAARQQQQQKQDCEAALGLATSGSSNPDAPQVLRRVCPAFKGWRIHQRPGSVLTAGNEQASRREQLTAEALNSGSVPDQGAASAAGTSDPVPHWTAASAAGAGHDNESEWAAESTISGVKQKPPGGSKAAPSVYGGGSRQREEDYYGVCHTDVVKCIVITEGGKIFTAGFDRAICTYDFDKLDKPKEAFNKVKDCARAGLTSLTFDPHNNVLLAGSLDGTLRIWSVEGRCLDKFEGLSNKPISAAHLPHINQWWATGRFGKLAAFDPRSPAIVTEYVAAPNQLLDHAVELLVAPVGSDLVLAGTSQRHVVVWQYHPHAAHRVFQVHDDWVEGLLVCEQADCEEVPQQAFFSFSADGHVCSWDLDTEQNCDVYRLKDDVRVADCNVLCMLHLPDQHCFAVGCEDGMIRLHYEDGQGPVPCGDGGPVPLALGGHDGKVTGLIALQDDLILSCGEDRSLRVWSLKTLKQVYVEADAHDTPIHCMAYSAATVELATCCIGSKVKVWSLSKPSQPRLRLVLDHAEAPAKPKSAGHHVAADVNPHGKSNMQWLTRSDIDGVDTAKKPASNLPDMVAEAIAHANEDVPEVTQVRWVGFKQCWVTTADDEMLRLWSPLGEKLTEFAFKGGSCKCLYVDEVNQQLLASTADKCAYLFKLDSPMPLARFSGHTDVISGIGYLPSLDCYITSSWDTTIRLWKRPQTSTAAAEAGSAGDVVPRPQSASATTAAGDAAYLVPEDSDEAGGAVSEYEKAHPLIAPKSLSQDHTLALLQAIGITDSSSTSSGKGGAGRRGRLGGRNVRDVRASDEGSLMDDSPDIPGSLGAKLQDLGRRLLQDINETASRVAAEKGASIPAHPAMLSAGGVLHSVSFDGNIAAAGLGGIQAEGHFQGRRGGGRISMRRRSSRGD